MNQVGKESKKNLSKGERLGWTSYKNAENVILSAETIKGKKLQKSDLEKNSNYAKPINRIMP